MARFVLGMPGRSALRRDVMVFVCVAGSGFLHVSRGPNELVHKLERDD